MLLQKEEFDGYGIQVRTHGQHRWPREEVVLCAVYHFAEPKEAIRRLQDKFPHIRFIWHTLTEMPSIDHDGVIPKADYRDATIYLTFNLSPPSLDLMPNLRFVQLLTSGYDHMRNTPLLSDPSIPVATSTGVSAPAIAQYVVMQILSWAHQYPRILQAMGERKWHRPEVNGRGYPMANVLAGKRVGIWGYGSIGRQTARILHSMGMHIIACTSSPKTTPESRRLHKGIHSETYTTKNTTGDDEGLLPLEWHSGATRSDLHRFLAADLDILAIFTPLTAQTHHALGRAEFDILSSSSSSPPFLVNVSRGAILVQDELVAALHDGRLAGAALDVTDPEPLGADHPLWAATGVSITPHMSWCFEEYVEQCLGSVVEENLRRLESGKMLVNQIQ